MFRRPPPGLDFRCDVDGCSHDAAYLDSSGVLVTMNPAKWIGDKGYANRGMITPTKKSAFRGLLINKQVSSIRATIELVLTHLKNWGILRTDYRRPLNTFSQTI